MTPDIFYAFLRLNPAKKKLTKLHDRIPTCDLEQLITKTPEELRGCNATFVGCKGSILVEEDSEDRKLFFEAAAEAIENYQANGVTKKLRKQMLKELIEGGLSTDGAHHKQWYLEQIAELMGIKIKKDDYEEGIP